MTPANRAPKVSLFGVPIVYTEPVAWQTGYASRLNGPDSFVFRQYEGGGESVTLYLSDEGKTWHRAGCDPIGPALPGPDRDGTTPGSALYNTMTPGSPIAWVYLPENHRALWETRASAVIAAHDAGKETERVDRWAVFDPDDETWWDGDEWNTDKSVRALYARYSGAAVQCSGNARAVRITTRRRRVVK